MDGIKTEGGGLMKPKLIRKDIGDRAIYEAEKKVASVTLRHSTGSSLETPCSCNRQNKS